MNELTIQLSHEAYHKLFSLSQASGIAPEKWVVEEISGMMRVAEASLGMELFPMEKQERLRALRLMNTEGKLNSVQQEEFRCLVVEAERQTHENLRRWRNLVRVPKGKENEFQRLMKLADTIEEQADA